MRPEQNQQRPSLFGDYRYLLGGMNGMGSMRGMGEMQGMNNQFQHPIAPFNFPMLGNSSNNQQGPYENWDMTGRRRLPWTNKQIYT